MKRFFCTSCNRMKCQRNWPRDIKYRESEVPKDRQGTCSRHATKIQSTQPTIRKRA